MKTNEMKFVEEFNNNPVKVIHKLNELADSGAITMRQHNDYPELFIFNYTHQTALDLDWNMYTLACRGLVIDVEMYKIKAIPFSKFFNYGELQNTELYELSKIEELPYEIYNKMDGSLGIGFFHKDNWIWATRGSFHSDQANFANEFVQKTFTKQEIRRICFEYENMTMLGEIIYPDNRIVVNYGDYSGIVLLGMIRNKDGKELPHTFIDLEANNIGFDNVERYTSSSDLSELFKHRTEWDKNTEGVVIRFSNGKRLKIKGEEYLKYHKAKFGLSKKKIAEAWYRGEFQELYDVIPEEFRPYLLECKENLDMLTDSVEGQILAIDEWLAEEQVERKDVHTFLTDEGIPKELIAGAFALLSKKEITPHAKKYVLKFYEDVLGDFNV